MPDYFELFDLAPKLSIDLADLEKRFYALSRKLHPDRFARASAGERARAEQATADLNDAYRTLRDPVARAKYVLNQQPEESRQAPPELLEEVFELNEALSEVQGGAESARPQVEAACTRFRNLLNEANSSLEALFARYDQGDAGAIEGIRNLLARRRYLANLVANADRVLTHA